VGATTTSSTNESPDCRLCAWAVPILCLALLNCAGSQGTSDPPLRIRAPEAVTGKVWQWERTVTPVETVESPAPDRYTLELAPNGRLLVRADCNRGTGAYRIGTGTLAIGPIATTRMACPPGSLDASYLGDLHRAAGFFVEGGQLFIELPVDSGTMRFAPQR
jgi:heat shock protein HslJ